MSIVGRSGLILWVILTNREDVGHLGQGFDQGGGSFRTYILAQTNQSETIKLTGEHRIHLPASLGNSQIPISDSALENETALIELPWFWCLYLR